MSLSQTEKECLKSVLKNVKLGQYFSIYEQMSSGMVFMAHSVYLYRNCD